MPSTAAPDPTCKGLTFLPVPEFDEESCAFGARRSSFFGRQELPEVPTRFRDEVERWFYEGGGFPAFGTDVDVRAARRAIQAWSRSCAPSTEEKTVTIAYALWVWSPAAARARAVQVEAA